MEYILPQLLTIPKINSKSFAYMVKKDLHVSSKGQKLMRPPLRTTMCLPVPYTSGKGKEDGREAGTKTSTIDSNPQALARWLR